MNLEKNYDDDGDGIPNSQDLDSNTKLGSLVELMVELLHFS